MGNIEATRVIAKNDLDSFYQRQKKKSSGVLIIDSNYKVTFFNKKGLYFFDVSDLNNVSLNDFNPKNQSHYELSNIKTADHIIETIKIPKNKKKTFVWEFLKKETGTWARIFVQPAKLGDEIQFIVMLKPIKKPPQSETASQAMSTGSSKNPPTNISIDGLVTDILDDNEEEKNGIIYKRGLTRIETQDKKNNLQKVENNKLGILIKEFTSQRDQLIKNYVNQQEVENGTELIISLQKKYNHELENFSQKLNWISPDIAENEKGVEKLKRVLQIKKFNEKILECESEILELKYQYLEEQVRRLRIKLAFSELIKKIKQINKESKQIKKKEIPTTSIGGGLSNDMNQLELFSDQEHESEYEEETELYSQTSHSHSSFSGTQSFNSDIDENHPKGPKITLDMILSKERYYKFFLRYCAKTGSEKKLLFYLDVENFQKLHKKKLLEKAEKIVKKYIIQGSTSYIGITTKNAEIIINNLKKGKVFRGLFNRAQDEIYQTMKSTTYLNFLKTEFYEKLTKLFLHNHNSDSETDSEILDMHDDVIKNNLNLTNISRSLKSKLLYHEKLNLKLNWFFNKDHQFEVNLKHNHGSLRMKADTAQRIGGHGTAPSPIEMIAFGLGAGYTRSLVLEFSKTGIEVDDLSVECIIMTNVKRILGIEKDEPLIPLIKFNVNLKSRSKNKLINKAMKNAEDNCPFIFIIKNIIHTTTETKYKQTRKERKENTKKIFNNINISNVNKYIQKVTKRKESTEIVPNRVKGTWNPRNTKNQPQFRAIVNYGKNRSDVWEADTPVKWGGKGNAPAIWQIFLSGIGSCYMSQIAFAASLNRVVLNYLSLVSTFDVNWKKIFSDHNNESLKNVAPVDNLDFKFSVSSTISESSYKKIDQLGMNKCLGIFMCNNSVPYTISLKLNEEKDELEDDDCSLM
ncbi:regulator of g protein signaling [Anaeramoeba flamelloides]|uniref:Regulator of g protein signaling n=1 Tax=Anaeramoeba flamelloides TaxID=1746091 RepID=A0AAV7ZS62_9EUKA|nr:regulator of g protein signaling [Anaeramoeba flamelloides]